MSAVPSFVNQYRTVSSLRGIVSPPLLTRRNQGWIWLSFGASSPARISAWRPVFASVQTLEAKPLQSARQPDWLPGSQTSPAAGFTWPSPQAGAVQSASQVALAPAVSQV